MTTNLILEAIKTAVVEGKATVNLKEASALTGSGSGVGGRVQFDDSFAALRMANPLRIGSRIIPTTGSDQAFVVKTGNATYIQNGTHNPWGYPINNNTGSPDLSTSFWQLPVRCINAQVPIRTAALSDINALDMTVVDDLALEFSQQEALSMMLNNDQAGSTTVQTGATYGLRGLNSYAGSTSAAAFGSNGSAITNGRHTVLQVQQASATALAYNDIANLVAAFPPQYYMDPSAAWMMHPTTIKQLRELKDTAGMPLFLEIGDKDGYSVGNVFGFPVIPNPYMQTVASGNFPVYLAAWNRFVTIADSEEMSIQRMDQTKPGYITIYAEKRVCSTIRDVFAGVRLYGA
jgi:HK97 family phage major capsid protein